MTITLAELAQRLQALEEEVARLRERLPGSPAAEAPAVPLAPPNPPVDDVHQETDIPTEAPGIEKLRAMFVAHGIYPGDERIRQAIAAMSDQDEDP
jgi:hypothetical protein